MKKLAVVMDPIANITRYKDTTYALLLTAQQRQWQIYYIEQQDLYAQQGKVYAMARTLQLHSEEKTENWFELSLPQKISLSDLDVVLMRKDPPFDMEYIYTTYLLEQADTWVINNPQALRDVNEKFFINHFPECCAPTLISRDPKKLHEFLQEHQDIVLKPLNAMGGESIFRVKQDDPNINVIIETLNRRGESTLMAQQFLPAVKQGDKRIILINGEPIPYGLVRRPAKGEFRANLAAGGSGQAAPLNEREHWICKQVGPTLRDKGLAFVGLDVIGDYLTEINVTSPTCVREIEHAFDIDITGQFFDFVESKI